MQLSKVKPDLDSIRYFFDENHHFHTSVDVYFSHQQQALRVHLIFPFGRNGNFIIENLEIYHHELWNNKKGNIEQYGLALARHVMVVLLGKNINEMEQSAKQQLEASFQQFVLTFARKLVELLQDELQFECEASSDYLSILTRMTINGEVIAGKIAINVYFTNDVDAEVFAEQLAVKYRAEILNQVNELQESQAEKSEDQTVFITTIPVPNPVSDEHSYGRLLEVSIKSVGYCERCAKQLVTQMGSNVNITVSNIGEHLDDLLLLIVGRTLQCDECGSFTKKEKIILWDHQTEQQLTERLIDELPVLGQMKEQESIQLLLDAAVEHAAYFCEWAEHFWNAFSFVAISQWEKFCQELTRFELLEGLRHFSDKVAVDSSKEILIKRVEWLVKSEADKRDFWRAANEPVIRHYLRLTVFGWELQKETEIIGEKRAEFIFQYLPHPAVLEPYYEKHAKFFSKNAYVLNAKEQNIIEKQQQKLRKLQQENGLLSKKLGSAYARIDEMETATFLVEQENRNTKDIIKIQQLKGLISELKEELAKVHMVEPEVDLTRTNVELTEVPEEKDTISLDEILSGKTILLLGGFRSKSIAEESMYKVISHDARVLDPAFYEMLKTADLIVVLTRFISHRAMWEAKEYAILEDKEIYYTAFTNVPTILHEIARKK